VESHTSWPRWLLLRFQAGERTGDALGLGCGTHGSRFEQMNGPGRAYHPIGVSLAPPPPLPAVGLEGGVRLSKLFRPPTPAIHKSFQGSDFF